MGAQAYNTISYSYVLLTWGKWKILVQISISLFLKSYGGSYGEFSEPAGFPHNFAPQKNDRQDLKISCIDAFRRQLQFVLKIAV
jgi:hypothetical protein